MLGVPLITRGLAWAVHTVTLGIDAATRIINSLVHAIIAGLSLTLLEGREIRIKFAELQGTHTR